MSTIKHLILIALVTVTAGCAATKAKVSFDKNTDIDVINYKTFAWLTQEKIITPAEDINPVMKVRVDKNIEQAFIAKGYQLVDEINKADFTVSYTIGSRDKIKINHYPVIYRHGLGRDFYDDRNYYGSIFMRKEMNVRQYTEGRLAIDVFDVKNQQPAWHGWATKRLPSADKDIPSEKLSAIIIELVDQFQ